MGEISESEAVLHERRLLGIETKIDVLTVMADRTEQLVRRTNGRVTELERQMLVHEAAKNAKAEVQSAVWKAAIGAAAVLGPFIGVTLWILDHWWR